MPDSLKMQIQEDVKNAMRAREKQKLGTLRLMMSELKRREVDERIELTDQDVLAILEKMLKQRKDSLRQYSDAGREDLAAQEQFEIDLIGKYLPEPLSPDAVVALIEGVVAELGATDMSAMGRVMGQLKPQLQGRADMAEVGLLVKQRLSGS
ncbi:MAG: GatB/YqeY domain-containing protein [Pseudomonadales bacterium]